LAKRGKRRLDYEKWLAMKASGKKVDDKIADMVEQYEALNETLKLELPKLSLLTEKIGNICLDRFACIQIEWWGTWQAKIIAILDANQMPKDLDDIVGQFRREFRYGEAQISELGIIKEEFLQGVEKGRLSQSTTATREDDASVSSRNRNGTLSVGSRSRGKSVNSDHSPNLPALESQSRFSDGIFPNLETTSSRRQTIEYPPISRENWLGSPTAAALDPATRPYSTRPNTGRSHDSGGPTRASVDTSDTRTLSTRTLVTPQHPGYDTSDPSTQKLHSSYPIEFDENPESQTSSPVDAGPPGEYKVLYLAASLFEFSFSGDKRVGDLRYLTYQAGEVCSFTRYLPPDLLTLESRSLT
jgi:dynamin-binding protein